MTASQPPSPSQGAGAGSPERIAEIRKQLVTGGVDHYAVNDLLAALDAQEAQIAQLQAERDELRKAIHPGAGAEWTLPMYVALAQAHRQDSDTIDEVDEEPLTQAGLIKVVQAKLEHAQAEVSALTARLARVQGLVEKLSVALRDFAEGDNGYERPTRDFAQRQYHECCPDSERSSDAALASQEQPHE